MSNDSSSDSPSIMVALTLSHPRQSLGTLTLQLSSVTPKTTANFLSLLPSYKSSQVHRLIPGFMAQMGDFINSDGTGTTSLYGPSFPDENFLLKHDRTGTLSMANSGPDTNGCQFFITFKPTPHLDGKHVVFGYVGTDDESRRVLRSLEETEVGRDDRPVGSLKIVEAERVGEEGDDVEKAEAVDERVATEKAVETGNTGEGGGAAPVPEEEEEEEVVDEAVVSAMTPLQRRVFKLKMKMNQSRKLNRDASLDEGRRRENPGAAAKAAKKANKLEREREFKALHKGGESASDIINEQRKKEQKKISRATFGWNQYNNESQYRNYNKRLTSVPISSTPSTGEIFDPIESSSSLKPSGTTEAGIARMAADARKRANVKTTRKRLTHDGEDVTGINDRNASYNKKLKRTMDKYTVGIRQNLERGTNL